MTIRFIGSLLCSGLLAVALTTGVEAQTRVKQTGVKTTKSGESHTSAAKAGGSVKKSDYQSVGFGATTDGYARPGTSGQPVKNNQRGKVRPAYRWGPSTSNSVVVAPAPVVVVPR